MYGRLRGRGEAAGAHPSGHHLLRPHIWRLEAADPGRLVADVERTNSEHRAQNATLKESVSQQRISYKIEVIG
jgi:hypothetical protein